MATQNATHRAGPADLEADIARQREQLAATVNELTEQVQARARTAAKQAAVAAGVAVVVIAVVVVVKRRRS
jgi:t-SNARE complex subunit (syntaxin)